MVAGLAFCATAIATLFAQATGVRWAQTRKPHHRAWTIALAFFALGAAMLAMGASTGWDKGTFGAFYLFGAILDVPWLALGTVYLLYGARVGKPVERGLVFFTGLALGVMLVAPVHGVVPIDRIPDGKELYGVVPRVLAGVGSGLGALVVFAGALWSAVQFLRRRGERAELSFDPGRMAGANLLIALGTLILASTGLLKGVAGGKDEAFALGLTLGIAVIYAGFAVASLPREASSSRRSSLPATLRGSDVATSKRAGIL
jgi:hypothetical protein